jgi:hypothetical protein
MKIRQHQGLGLVFGSALLLAGCGGAATVSVAPSAASSTAAKPSAAASAAVATSAAAKPSAAAGASVAGSAAAKPSAGAGGSAAAGSVSAKPSAAASAAGSASASPVVLTGPAVQPPAGTQITISSPKNGATVPAGDVTVTFTTAIDLVAAAQAKSLNDYHAHALLDVDPTPYLGTDVPVPAATDRIIHTGAKSVTFMNVAPGQHKLTVFLSFGNHTSVKPPVSDSVTFTAQ